MKLKTLLVGCFILASTSIVFSETTLDPMKVYGEPKTSTTVYSVDFAFNDYVETELDYLRKELKKTKEQQDTMVIFSIIAIFIGFIF